MVHDDQEAKRDVISIANSVARSYTRIRESFVNYCERNAVSLGLCSACNGSRGKGLSFEKKLFNDPDTDLRHAPTTRDNFCFFISS